MLHSQGQICEHCQQKTVSLNRSCQRFYHLHKDDIKQLPKQLPVLCKDDIEELINFNLKKQLEELTHLAATLLTTCVENLYQQPSFICSSFVWSKEMNLEAKLLNLRKVYEIFLVKIWLNKIWNIWIFFITKTEHLNAFWQLTLHRV